MSYYILPRIKTDFVLKPQLFNNKDKVSPCISQSLIKYMNESRIILEQQMSLDINKAISIRTSKIRNNNKRRDYDEILNLLRFRKYVVLLQIQDF